MRLQPTRSRRPLCRALLPLSLAFSVAARDARAWDDYGHMVVAAVAFKHLKQKTRARVAELLQLNPSYPNWIVGAAPGARERVAFLRAATWPDAIKSDPAYQQDEVSAPTAARNIGYADRLKHGYWHYINLPFSPDGTPLQPPPAVNAATQIAAFRAALAAPETSADVKSYDLVWLLHLVGDVHQPLHCVARFHAGDTDGDRGGNDVQVAGNSQPPVCDDPRYCPYGPPDDLHGLFDTILGSGYATDPPLRTAAALPAPDPRQAAIRDEEVWIQEGLELARSAIYVAPIGIGQGPYTITPEYQARASELGKRRAALAGVRLANLLNDSLGR